MNYTEEQLTLIAAYNTVPSGHPSDMIELTDELLDRLGDYYSHQLTQEIHPELSKLTFDQFVQQELKTKQWETMKGFRIHGRTVDVPSTDESWRWLLATLLEPIRRKLKSRGPTVSTQKTKEKTISGS